MHATACSLRHNELCLTRCKIDVNIDLNIVLRRLTGCRTTDVERPHRQLRTRFADALGGDAADHFAARHARCREHVLHATHEAELALRHRVYGYPSLILFAGLHMVEYEGERTAEQIKIEVGAATADLDNPPEDYPVRGRDLMTGIPKEILVSYVEIAQALDKSISKIEEAIHSALEQTPPELSADIYKTGIYLAGGGALLRGLDKRISAKTKLPVHVADDPLHAVAKGTAIALKNIDRFTFLMRN